MGQIRGLMVLFTENLSPSLEELHIEITRNLKPLVYSKQMPPQGIHICLNKHFLMFIVHHYSHTPFKI